MRSKKVDNWKGLRKSRSEKNADVLEQMRFPKTEGQKGLELSFCGLLGRLGENAHRYYQGGCSQSTQAVDHHIFGIQRTS